MDILRKAAEDDYFTGPGRDDTEEVLKLIRAVLAAPQAESVPRAGGGLWVEAPGPGTWLLIKLEEENRPNPP